MLVSVQLLLMAASHVFVTSADLSHYISSTPRLALLASKERRFVSILKNYVAEEKQRLSITQGWLQRLSETSSGPRASGHPVAFVHLVERLHLGWKSLLGHLSDINLFADLQKNFTELPDLTTGSTEDLRQCLLSLLRLQDVYLLQTDDLADGLVVDFDTHAPLTAWDCRNLGIVAMQQGMFHLAVPWLARAKSSANHDQHIIESINKVLPIAEVGLEFAEGRDSDIDAEFEDADFGVRWEKWFTEGEVPTAQGDFEIPVKSPTWQAYEALCRTSELPITSNGHCAMVVGSSPLEIFKAEFLSHNPLLVIFHDFVSEIEASGVIAEAYSKTERAKVGGGVEGDVTDSRLGQITWLHPENSTNADKLSRRVSSATKLDAGNYAELFQVSTYGIAGHYEPHYDFSEVKFFTNPVLNQQMGDRIATFMIYLNNVVAGGRTVFPRLNLAIEPIKNSAVFWHNLLDNGQQDDRTIHGACPVLLGHKWVANKWIHEFGQEFNRPCLK